MTDFAELKKPPWIRTIVRMRLKEERKRTNTHPNTNTNREKDPAEKGHSFK